MSVAGRADATGAEDARALADAIEGADLLRIVFRGDGDGLAAAGLLAGACAAVGTPYHTAVARTRADVADRVGEADAGATTIVLGADNPVGPALVGHGPLSPTAHAAAGTIGSDPDPVLTLAGTVAAGSLPDVGPARDIHAAADLTRRPGIASPTADPADGLAHSTWFHAPFSGDPDAAREALSGLDTDGGRGPAGRERVASLAALLATGAGTTPRAAETIALGLRPHATDGPFATLEGYADVLRALASAAPGRGIALAVGADGVPEALEAWRDHAHAVHGALRSAETARHRGLLVARVDEGPVVGTARLLRDVTSPEPAVLAVGDGTAAVAGSDTGIGAAIEAAAEAVGGSGLAADRTGYAAFDGDAETFVSAFRGAL